MRVLDELDLKILEILRKDGRASFRSLASQVGISNVAVRDRMNKLIRDEYIKGFFALIDSNMIGKRVSVIFDVITNPLDIEEVAQELSNWPEVTRIYERAGNSQLQVHALFHDVPEMQRFIKEKLYKTHGIANVNSTLVMRRYKYDPSISF